MRGALLSSSLGLCAVLVLVAGCGSSQQSSATPALPSAATSASPIVSTPSSTPPTARPSLPAAPADFKAASITFVSSDEAFCLGTAPGHGTLLLRSLDRGQTWVRLAAPKVPLGRPGSGSAPFVWGTRFDSPSHGFIFGHGLWETTDGGRHWTLDAEPSGSVLSLATIDGQVLALTAKGTAQSNLGPYLLLRRALSGGSWSTVATLPPVDLVDPTDLISTQAGSASWLERSRDDGRSWATLLTYGDGGVGWGDLGFTTPSDAVVVHGAADAPGNTDSRPGQLLLSSDGGVTWRPVTF